jgi:hypothetical protein
VARHPGGRVGVRDICQACGKRRFGSACAARRAHQGAGYRVRAYRCSSGAGWHVAASEKAGAHAPLHEAPASKRPQSSRRPSLAPVRTLAEVEAIAREKRHYFATADGGTLAELSIGPEGMKFEVLRNARG